MQIGSVKRPVWFAASALLFGSLAMPAPAAYSSLYIFGDGVSTTTTNPAAGPLYYGLRYCNGRVWVEVLAQRQGLTYDSSKNLSYFGHYSSNLVVNVNTFVPAYSNTDLVVVWVNNADFVGDMTSIGDLNNPSHGTNLAEWVAAIGQSITNHQQAVQTLYAKGVRTLIMPTAVDITEIPEYVGLPSANKVFIRQRVIDFNTGFRGMLSNAMVTLPDLRVYVPDAFSLLDDMLAHSANYGLTNALDYRGLSIDALEDPSLTDLSLNGPGATYVFWDYQDPTAKAQAVLAESVQQLISPVQFRGIARLNGSNRLDMVNIPIGRDGCVNNCTNLVSANWAADQGFASINATQSLFVPVSGPKRFYRLSFPFVWTWP